MPACTLGGCMRPGLGRVCPGGKLGGLHPGAVGPVSPGRTGAMAALGVRQARPRGCRLSVKELETGSVTLERDSTRSGGVAMVAMPLPTWTGHTTIGMEVVLRRLEATQPGAFSAGGSSRGWPVALAPPSTHPGLLGCR